MHVSKAELRDLAFLGHFSRMTQYHSISLLQRVPSEILNTFNIGLQLCFLTVKSFVWQTNLDMLDSHKSFEWIKKQSKPNIY